MKRLVGTAWNQTGDGEWQLLGDVTGVLFAVVQCVGGSYAVRTGPVPAVGEWPITAVRPTLEDAQRVGDALAYHETVGRRFEPGTTLPPPAERPKIVTFCGSSRFVAEQAVLAWTLQRDEGVIVLPASQLLPANYPGLKPDHQAEAEGVNAAMDELHLRKIDLADVVMVVNIDGYIRDSTRREIAYAQSRGKPIRYLVPPPGPEGT